MALFRREHNLGVSRLSPERLNRYLALPDLTDSSSGVHAINIVLDKLVKAIERWSKLKAEIVRSSPIVSVKDNYDRLYYEPDAVARSVRYSHYVDDETILRTHTTAAVPGLLRSTTADRLMVLPGLVYRRDTVDRTHVGEPHQVDLWMVQKGRLRRSDLLNMIEAVMSAILPGVEYRCNETIHPYTVNGLEVEARLDGDWLEILECGEAHPWLLNDSGLASQKWSGLAMGIGLDRLVMLLKGIHDIRLLRNPDARIARQMVSLAPYEPVSNQPPVKLHLSVTVADPDMELVGDKIRETLGDRCEWIEDVELIMADSWDRVPPIARDRLGMAPDQTNLLIELRLRSPTESIPKKLSREIYREVYLALHEGTGGYIFD